MAYLDDIPDSNDIQPISQSQIKTNFKELERQFSVDHDSLLEDKASGKHLKVTLPEVTSDPATAANEGCVYTKDSGTQPELFYREESSGDVVQLTEDGRRPSYIKAFVSFDNTGVIIGEAYNVTSVTGSLVYTINFTNALADTNYLVVGNPNSSVVKPWIVQTSAKTVNSCTVICHNLILTGDLTAVDIAIIRIL